MLVKTGLSGVGVLDNFKNQMTTNFVRSGDWRIVKQKDNKYLIMQHAFDGTVFFDHVQFIESYLDKLYNRSFTSILCGGLGMGVAPFLTQPFCTKVDVVELDSEVIDLVKNNTNYLHSKVNIIQGDIMTHTTNEKYDVILIDIWVNNIEDLNQQKPILEAKYAANLNPGGLLYFPLADKLS